MSQPSENGRPGHVEVQTPTTCRICKQQFYGPDITGALILGEPPSKREARYIGVLMSHLATHHPKEFNETSAIGAELAGALKLACYETGDPLVEKKRDELRWRTLQRMMRASVTDQRIRERVREVLLRFQNSTMPGLVPDLNFDQLAADLTALCCEMRDVLQEKGRYSLT